jgi:NADPH:quinone reductase-like Zn-dependent oxidoreductase
VPISGLTAWQALFDHGRLTTGQTVLIHGATGGVGSIAVQLAREAGARVIGTFLDLQAEKLEDAGEADVVLDVFGGDILDRSAALVRAGGTLVSIAMPPRVRPKDGRAVFFVVEPDRAWLTDLAMRVRDGRIKPVVGAVRPLAETPGAFAPGVCTPVRQSSGSGKSEQTDRAALCLTEAITCVAGGHVGDKDRNAAAALTPRRALSNRLVGNRDEPN